MARKTKEESQLTRDKILDAAEEIFLNGGVGAATVAQIADRAGVSRGAVYGHYKNKVDICLGMCRRAVLRLGAPPQPQSDTPHLEVLHSMGMHLLKHWIQPGSLHRVMIILYCQLNDSPELEPLRRFRRGWEIHYRLRLRRQLRRCIKAGELPASLDFDKAVSFINCYTTGIYHCVSGERSWLYGDWDRVEELLHTVLDGLRHCPRLRKSTE